MGTWKDYSLTKGHIDSLIEELPEEWDGEWENLTGEEQEFLQLARKKYEQTGMLSGAEICELEELWDSVERWKMWNEERE